MSRVDDEQHPSATTGPPTATAPTANAPTATAPTANAPTATPHGPLQPIELATASVLGAMTVVLVLAGWFLPHASAIAALGAVPMGVIARRHRCRAVIAGVVSAASVGFLVAGTGVISSVVLWGLVGGIAGHAHRRHWGRLRLLGCATMIAPAVAGVAVGVLVAFSKLRKLTLEQLRNTWRGFSGLAGRLVAAVPGQAATGAHLTSDLDHAVAWGIRNWWETIGVAVFVFVIMATTLAWYLLDILFARLERVKATDRLAAGGAAAAPVTRRALRTDAASTAPVPVPVTLSGVTVRYPGADFDALSDVSVRIGAGEMVAVLGPNGSGKSTMSRLLAGCTPTSGEVRRDGDVGLGVPGGTALVAQRPESQILGVRVLDDLVWGLPRHFDVDTAGLLAAVGLSGMEGRETSGLSGGQLQRLAVAAALARRPRLLISDESTAMIDADGRHRLVELLSALPRQREMTVVHVTHQRAETARADRVVELAAGRVVADRIPSSIPPKGRPASSVSGNGALGNGALGNGSSHGAGVAADRRADIGPAALSPPPTATPVVLSLHDVGHVYAEGTPWAQVALRHVDLDVRAGGGVLVVGDNGSGKSTLAWILAGLLRPTFGDCRLNGESAHGQIGAVGLAFQHSRLQVQRSTVGRDVSAAGDVERPDAEAAMRRVGLDPDRLWDRAVDELSGGQLRRVALAGLLTRTPSVLVLDEPLAGLDDGSRLALIAVLADLRVAHGLTLVVISHDLEGAGDVCDRVVRLESGAVVADSALQPIPVIW